MTIEEALKEAKISVLDAEVLLGAIVNHDRSWIISHSDALLTKEHEKIWNEWHSRRVNHEPVAYILGTKEFYGRNFLVSPHVLIPRPSTEGLIDVALRVLDSGESIEEEVDRDIVAGTLLFNALDSVKTVVDIGTGSGCIAITLKLERPDLTIIATDISNEALTIAKKNAKHLNADIDFRLGSNLSPLSDLKDPFLIVTNPPYIQHDAELPPDVSKHEPKEALYGDQKSLQALITEARNHPACTGVVIECGKRDFSVLK